MDLISEDTNILDKFVGENSFLDTEARVNRFPAVALMLVKFTSEPAISPIVPARSMRFSVFRTKTLLSALP